MLEAHGFPETVLRPCAYRSGLKKPDERGCLLRTRSESRGRAAARPG